MSNSTSVLKVGCGKFFCDYGVISQLPAEIKRFGGKAMFIGGPTGLKIVMDAAKDAIEAAGIEYKLYEHTGFCTREWGHKYEKLAKEGGFTVIVGCGGGKCVDMAKCTSAFADLPVITVPTSVATCVGTSMLAVMYDEKGHITHDVYLEKEVEVCIADLDLIGTAPVRTLAAGVLDSMAKYPECYHHQVANSYRDCALTKYIQIINADGIYKFGMGEGRDLYQNGKDAELFREAVINNLLHTSIVSGFAQGTGQLALAHGVYGYMRTNDDKNALRIMHGEWVALGLIVQKYFNQDSPEEIEAFISLMRDMNVPTTLKETGYDTSPASIKALEDDLIKKCAIAPEEEERVRQGVKLIVG